MKSVSEMGLMAVHTELALQSWPAKILDNYEDINKESEQELDYPRQ